MTADFENFAVAESTAPRPIRPSPFVRIVMRPLTKRLNPLMLKMAGRDNFHMAGQVRHVGRRSGRSYVTPVSARLSGDVAVIPLTFGNVSDWAQNVRAAGGCEIRQAGQEYVASNPSFVAGAEIRPLLRTMFARRERVMFSMLGIVQFVRLDVTAIEPIEPVEAAEPAEPAEA